jgi:hypothetical protein
MTTVYEIKIEGTRDLLMHNVRLADPLDYYALELKKVTSLNKKSQADHEKMAEIEWRGGLYYDDEIGPFVPNKMLFGCLREGSKTSKLGSIFKSDISIEPTEPLSDQNLSGYKLDYVGPRDATALYEATVSPKSSKSSIKKFVNRENVTVSIGKTIMRTRPQFPRGWSCTFKLASITDAISAAQIEQLIIDAGLKRGIGDYVPQYGLFVLKSFKKV